MNNATNIQFVSYVFSLRKKCSYSEFSGPSLPVFERNAEIYSVTLRIQSKRGKIRTRKTANTDTFYEVFVHEGLLKRTDLTDLRVSVTV